MEAADIAALTQHNSRAWPLPDDLTAEVFSRLLDTSMIRIMACTCTDFRRAAEHPLCYQHICVDTDDLFLVDDERISSLLQRATIVRSINIADHPFFDFPFINGSFLLELNEVKRNSIEKLVFNNLRALVADMLLDVLPLMVNLKHLEVRNCNCPMYSLLTLVSRWLPLVETLVLHGSIDRVSDRLTKKVATELVNNCPFLKRLYMRQIHMPDGAFLVLSGLQLQDFDIILW